jgi:hypothetical protein
MHYYDRALVHNGWQKIVPSTQNITYCQSRNSIFRPNTAFSDFFDPRRRRTTPAVEKILRPCLESKSTVSGWALINNFNRPVFMIWSFYYVYNNAIKSYHLSLIIHEARLKSICIKELNSKKRRVYHGRKTNFNG